MIVIKAGSKPGIGYSWKCYEVFLGGEQVRKCTKVWALWNGGPGLVEYLPEKVNGQVYLDDSGTDVARAYRVGLVTVRGMEGEA